jgi:hypothetical protein
MATADIIAPPVTPKRRVGSSLALRDQILAELPIAGFDVLDQPAVEKLTQFDRDIIEPLAKVKIPNFRAATVVLWGRFFAADGADFVALLA